MTDPYLYFSRKNGRLYAGTHLLVDMWGGQGLTDIDFVEQTLIDAAKAANATVLHSHIHPFESSGGLSGVVVLAESHISIHTWPESNYTAMDIFMCASCDPYLAIPVLQQAFQPKEIKVEEKLRGEVNSK